MKKKNIIVSFFLMIILLSTYVYATVDTDVIAKISSSSSNVKRGDEIQVDLYLDNFEYEGKGVDEFVIRIDINENIIKDITVNNIVTNNGTITLGNNTLAVEDVNTATEDEVIFSNLTSDCDYKIFMDLKNPYTIENYQANAKVISIKYTVKDDATLGDVENAISYSVDLSQQVTAEDLKNGFSSYKVSAVNDKVFLTVGEKVVDNKDEDETTKDDDTNQKDETTKEEDTNKKDETTKEEDTNKKDETTKEEDTNKKDETTKEEDTNKKDEVTKDDDTTKNPTDGTTNDDSDKSSGTDTSLVGGTKLNSTTSTKILPAAGLKRYVFPIIIFVGIALISYKKYNTYKDIK